ncbi:hypothetical protein COT20_02270 [bacterium (Candidatus Gribaldobacteria) CG08_land_8_20_14_0_20_39_15]|uniref:Uncharacterized protein n=1 Tax=bacterium (Candidatus Gribaldobacteria) CG08_land_8_20_14_0_20_39_15 TaxID=2014273 RepID=A0A2M6XUA8_9BACT|nr:MAG: hypothetical protein COT20_02270 [bacterium (Candidatus Gribaldobacteria) CG08_land_8_20_14_0_20_39_15]
MVGKEYWDFLGGENTFEELLKLFDSVGEKLKEKEISLLGDLLLLAGALLEKIESGENKKFNAMIFKKTMRFYCAQMKEYEH